MSTEPLRTLAKQPRGLMPILVGWLVAVALGAGPPQAVRVRVPSARVGGLFPPGTELRGMEPAKFDALLDAAQKGYLRQASRTPTRLLRAHHSARWEGGILQGRSELVVERSPAGPAELTLFPWTPAIEVREPGTSLLRMHDDGRTAIQVEASGVSTIALRWQLRARPSSEGRGFTLGLPATALASLALDLPAGWVPEGPEGIAQGPRPTAEEGRRTWRFDGRGGLVNLRLRPSTGDERGALREPRIWVSGPTRVELNEASASWTTDWTVQLEPQGPRRLRVELDEGLEFIGVAGAGVVESRARRSGATTELMIELGTQVAGPVPLTIRATARVPGEGSWTIPAARPIDGVWTGGRTTVRLDGSRILKDCRVGAGRRVAARPGEDDDASLLVFDAIQPRSVAVLVFDRPRPDVSVEVRGQLLLGNSAPRLESQLTWRLHRGRLHGLDVDLPPAWVPERVHVAGIDEPLDWHPETRADGTVRVHVTPPSGDFMRNALVLNLAATAAIAGGRGPIMLPRVRPVGARVVDERWLAWTESGVTLQPVMARGLAWIDPALVIGPTAERPEAPGGLREALAWHWIADEGEARVERGRVRSDPTGKIHLHATVDRDRLGLEWTIAVDVGERRVRSVVLGLAEPIAGARRWRFTDASSGLPLSRRTLEAARRPALGLPESGEAWELVLPDARTGPITIRARLELPWSGSGRIPLLVLPERFQGQNVVVVDVARNLQSTVESAGLVRLDPLVAAEAVGFDESNTERETAEPRLPLARRRRAHAFAYTQPGGRLELRTETLERARAEGVIDRALLTSFINVGGPSRHRLSLRVAVAEARSLELTMPTGATLIRLRRDGQPVVSTGNGRSLSLPLAPSAPARPFCTLTIDYLTPRPPRSDGLVLQPERPRCSLPILGLCWEVVAPEPWGLAEHGPGLVATDPAPAPSWVRRVVGPWRSAWTGAVPVEPRLAADMLRAVDECVARAPAQETTLGDWLTRGDASAWPLVVDRLALETAGWGPKSRIVPDRTETSKYGTARGVLEAVGLTLVPLGEAIVVTTLAEAPDRGDGQPLAAELREAWQRRLREAVVWGSDVSDRFETIDRWRHEATPRMASAAEPTDPEVAARGWRRWRFAAAGWPEAGATLRLVDERKETASSWAAGLAVLALGIVIRGLGRSVRALGLTVLLALAIVATAIAPRSLQAIAAGAFAGGLAVLFFWMGSSLPWRVRSRAREVRGSSTTRTRESGFGVATAVLAGLALCSAGRNPRVAVAQADDPSAPIAVLFPYDGLPDPARAPDRAILRLADFERLTALAESDCAPAALGVAATEARHRVAWESSGEVAVESEFALAGSGRGAGTWTFPVGSAREIRATVDDVPAPVLIQPGGHSASVQVEDPGPHRLRIRRTVLPRRTEDGESLSLPINPLASALVEVGPGPEGRRIELPSARGAIEAQGERAAGYLGPVQRLEVRWVSDRAGPGSEGLGAVEALMLWDAEPAGDHLWARLTYHNPEGTPVVRLRLEPGLVVRADAIPGLLDSSIRDTPDGPEWMAAVDPPIPDGTTIRLELWKPQPGGEALAQVAERAFPRIEPVGIERYSGEIGFRRPPDWSGRLAAGIGEPITEEGFVRSWGNLPEEPLTLSGAARFVGREPIAVRTGPAPERLAIAPAVLLSLGPGRIDVDLRAELTQVSGRSFQAELKLPPQLGIIRVEGDGLTDWSRTGDSLLVRWDGAAPRERAVRVQGWLPVPHDPLATAPARQEVAVPWPVWRGYRSEPGTLVISSPTPFELDPPMAAAALPAAATGPPPGGAARYRATYRVERPEQLGRLRWEIEPPRVSVQVRSQLTIHPDSAELVAVLRYDVSGGARDTIRLTLSTAWAEGSEVKLEGGAHQLRSESRGATTTWTIETPRPIWGSQRVIVRAHRAFSGDRAIFFPELKGTAGVVEDTYLAIVNASGREFATERSPGLQPTNDTARFQADEFTSLAIPPTSIYRVTAEGWSLKLEPSAEAGQSGRFGVAENQVSLAEVDATLGPDGAVLGSLRAEVECRSEPFLPLKLPEGSTLLWLAIDGVPARALRAESGQWLVPLETRRTSRVVVIWQTSAPRAAATVGAGSVALPLPSLEQARVPLFVGLRTPVAFDVLSGTPALEAVSSARQEIARAEWIRRSIVDSLAAIDRSSVRARETLVSELVDLELVLRRAERAAAREATSGSLTLEAAGERIRQQCRGVRAALAEALATTGLEDLAEAARVQLGLVRKAPGQAVLEVPEPSASIRLRRLGRSRQFQGETRGTGAPVELVRTPRSITGTTSLPASERREFLIVALVVPLGAWGVVRRPFGTSAPGALAVGSVVLAGVVAGGGPMLPLVAAAAALLGWVSAGSTRGGE